MSLPPSRHPPNAEATFHEYGNLRTEQGRRSLEEIRNREIE
ncbi:hypothetical protein N9D38_03305 [Rubripirellula sp.]|nr:hypothetical protein [Rubripirellula sp.]